MKYFNEYIDIELTEEKFAFVIDWILFRSVWNCRLGLHAMDWVNEAGEAHCWCYKYVDDDKD